MRSVSPVKVFISHSSTDKWIARQISKQLEEKGIEPFLDEKDIETGDVIGQMIQKNLSECDELLMLLSPAALKSSWVLLEVGGAMALGKRLVPILLHVGANDLPDPLNASLARDLNDIETYYDELVRRLQAPEPVPSEMVGTSSGRPQRAPKTFQVGEMVRLPQQIPGNQTDRMGNDVGWNEEMTDLLGEEATVVHAAEESGRVTLDIDEGAWVWLMHWLEPVSSD